MAQNTKKQIIDKFKTHEGDTGSPEVQVALLSQRIDNVASHLKSHAHDNHSRRGLLSMINKRRRLLHYLTRKAPDRYKDIIGKLGLAKKKEWTIEKTREAWRKAQQIHLHPRNEIGLLRDEIAISPIIELLMCDPD